MKQLYFHFNSPEKGICPHTYCVEKTSDGTIYVGYSVVHKNDHFCRKTGREVAQKKIDILKTIDDQFFKTDSPSVDTLIHRTIDQTFPYVAERCRQIFKINSQANFKILADTRDKRIALKLQV